MNRPLLWLLVPVLAVVAWLALRLAVGEPAPASPQDPAAANPVQAGPVDPVEATTAPIAAAEVSRVEATVDTAGASKQLPIPDDAIWLDLRVIDAATRQPMAGAEVRWSAGAVWQQVSTLPERERQEFRGDQEMVAERFGWLTHSDAAGLARIAADKNGAQVHGRSEGRYGMAYLGGQRDVPKEGWVLELEPDLTLRARVLDALGRPAIGAHVAIRMFDQDGKALRNTGWIQPQQAKAPDAVAEFRHVQQWLRTGTSKQRSLDVGHWRVAAEVPGVDGPAVEFDADAPPTEPVELRLPATGRIAARLVHEGQTLTDGVTFQAYRGEENDTNQRNNAPRHFADADGWARLPFVAVGGQVVVVAGIGAADVTRTVAAPQGQDQEVRVELTTDGLYMLRGQFVGPDGALLTNATVQMNYDVQVQSGNGTVQTDAQGRFLWLLTRGFKDSAQIERLVFSQQFRDGTPARTVTVPPREIRRGINDLGVLQLSDGAVVVAGKLQFDVPQQVSRGWFQVEALSDRRGRKGEERWEQVRSLTSTVRDDGTFDVRGETGPQRYRLSFPWGGHLPVAPVEFRVGATGLVIPIQLGHRLEAKVLADDQVPRHLLRGTLRPAFTPPTEYGGRSGYPFGDRYQANCWGPQAGEATLSWQGLPAGSYALEVGAMGLVAPAVRIEEVVLPLPEGGDGRLDGIDLRGKLQVLEVQVSLPRVESDEERGSRDLYVFAMPQTDDQHWHGLPVVDGKLSMPVVPGPLELMVVGGGCQPQRVTLTAEQVAAGTVAVQLRAWPLVELLFPGLPELPEGFELRVHTSPVAPAAARRFTAAGTSGGLDSYLRAPGAAAAVARGRTEVMVGEGAFRLGAFLIVEGARRGEALASVTPKEIQGGDNLPPISVQLSAEEVRAVIEKMKAEKK